MSEQNLRHRVRDCLKPGFVLQVENSVGYGTPDTHYCFEGISGWLELKFGENIPARHATPVFKSLNRGLEVEQEAMNYKYAQNGGKNSILAQIGKCCYIVPGIRAYEFNTYTMEEFQQYLILLKNLREYLKHT